jgi:prepilin-type N-terminal cleavage/methylation domain-containing protein
MGELRLTGVRRSRAAGFTLVEVMVSLSIIMFGALAITTLQRSGIRSSSFARKQSIALEIAERWAARFKQDAHTWTQVAVDAGSPTALTVLQNTLWLRRIAVQPNEFQPIPLTVAPVSPAFDFYGNDVLAPANTPFTFCAAFRPSWVYFGRTMRIDIRVWWRRENDRPTGSWIEQDFPACGSNIGTLNPGGAQLNNYHVVYLPVIVSMVNGN